MVQHSSIDHTGVTGVTTVATDTIFDAKGDLAVGTGANTSAKRTVGANLTILTADSTQSTGMKWIQIIRGYIAADGSTIRGTGFTSAKLATGKYSITFGTAFAAAPIIVTADAHSDPGAGDGYVMQVDGDTVTTTYAEIWGISGAGAATDTPWTFIAIEP